MATTLTMRRKYRKSLKKSRCRKKTMRKCISAGGWNNLCIYTKKTAKKPRYCRKTHNKRYTQKGGLTPQTCLFECPSMSNPNQHKECWKKCLQDL